MSVEGAPLVREIAQPVLHDKQADQSRRLVETLFRWDRGVGELRSAGVVPRVCQRMADSGIRVPDRLFEVRGQA